MANLTMIQGLNDSALTETKWLQSLVSSLGKKPAAEPQEDEPANAATSYAEGEGSLVTIASEILNVPAGTQRLVFFTDHTTLRQRYLVSGGSGAKAIEGLDDNAISNMATMGGSSPLIALPQNFYMKQMVAPPASIKADRAILINAPTQLVAAVKAAGADSAKAKEALAKVLHHKFYVCTLNMPAVFKLGLQNIWTPNISADDAAKTMDPAILENYPSLPRLSSAKLEWKDHQAKPMADREASVSNQEREADLNKRERDAQAMGRPQEGELEKLVIDLVARFHETAEGDIKPESFVKNYLDREFNFGNPKKQTASKEDVGKAVLAVYKRLRIPKLDEVGRMLTQKI